MALSVVPLGTNGYYTSYGRQTASYLVLSEQEAVLLDAGTGVGRLGEPAVRTYLEPYDHLSVVLSHYHLDHVIGLFCLPSVWERGPVQVYAPARPLLEVDPLDALSRIFSPPFSSRAFADLDDRFRVVPFGGERLAVGPLEFAFWLQQHPGGSLGMRIGDTLAYATDKALRDEEVDRVRGVKLLLHELWLTDAEAEKDPDALQGHSRLGAVAALARSAGVEAIMPIHHHPDRNPEDLRALCRELESRAGVPVVPPVEGKAWRVA